ncbi:hepatitis A virus cellular receptor 1-like [Diachasma alloeum]|uniref:hepatitis A virus cellular receptor 1-like n=1 Tax=Diachasma alloeum TaxID=454923 RepID=UPI0007384F23|nr:hepatitis A virus cellular receptor 1-like [Diachasma alloeum]
MPAEQDISGCVGMCPVENINNEVHLLPHQNCSQFCSCIHGTSYVIDCPKDLYYSEEDRVCTFQSEAQCKISGERSEAPPSPNALRQFVDDLVIPRAEKGRSISLVTHIPTLTVTGPPTTVTVIPTSTTTCIVITETTTPTSTTITCLPSTATVTSTITATCLPSTITETSTVTATCLPSTTTETSTVTATCLPTTVTETETSTSTVIPTPTGTVTPTITVTTIPTETFTCTDTVTITPSGKVIPTLIATPILPVPTTDPELRGCIGTCSAEDPINVIHLPHEHCNKFCKCSYGLPHIFTCDLGLHFNPKLQVCDIPSNANCKGIVD